MMEATVCHMKVPLGIDVNPIFSWIPKIKKRGDCQTAYQLIISSSFELVQEEVGDLWDSGLVASADFTEIPYGGQSLHSKTTYFWQVSSYCGDRIQKSQIQSFHTGFFREEWQGTWIGGKPLERLSFAGANWIGQRDSLAKTHYFRKKIPSSQKSIKTLMIGLKGNDQVTVYLNGEKLGSQNYRYTGVQYDVTEKLRAEENILAVESTTTESREPGVIVTGKITYSDGSLSTFVSDSSWQVAETVSDGWQETFESRDDWQFGDNLGLFGDHKWGDTISLETPDSREAVRLRKAFQLNKEIKSAHAYICGLGFFELTINGFKPDDSVMNPFNSQFNKSVLYRTFDITDLVTSGENVVAIELGNGFYNEIGGVWNWATASWRDTPKARLNVDICYSDGRVETLVTDESWKVSLDGPTVANSYYYGEIYDARKEQVGWNQAGYDDNQWPAAQILKAPAGKLRSQLKAPVREVASFKPKRIDKLSNGSYLVSGQEMVAGWLELCHINEPVGTKITITYGQTLNQDGTVKRYGGPDGELAFWWPHAYLQQDIYICKGSGDEQFKPKYSYKGHQYIQIDGYTNELTESDVRIYRTSNDIKQISAFSSSNHLFNQLHEMMGRAMANNFHGDHCDPVIEKIGWTGDANVSLDCLMFNYDMRGSLIGWLQTMEDGFEEYGIVPLTAPTANWGIENYVVWNSLFVYGVEYLAKHYGVNDYVKAQYPVMKRYTMGQIDVLRKNNWIWPDDQLGDWVSPIGGENPTVKYNENTSEGSGITGTALIYGVLDYLQQLAETFGDTADAELYQEVRQKIYQAFQEAYFKSEQGYYQTTTWKQIGSRTRYRQSDNLVPLAFNLVPDQHISGVVSSLVRDIQNKGEHLDTGCVGTRYLLPILSQFGHSDLAYRIANKKTYPSWGYWVDNGASSTWEMWEATTRSYDHYFLGTYDEWFYSHLAGIQQIRNGYQTFTIQPEFMAELIDVRCEIETVRGKLGVKWQRLPNKLVCQIEIPFGSQAQFVFPFKPQSIQLDDEVLSFDSDGLSQLVFEEGKTKLQVGAGQYQFSCLTC